MVCYAAIQFMLGSAEYFNAHPIAETDFYFVQRLSSLARVVVVGMAALGSGVTGGEVGSGPYRVHEVRLCGTLTPGTTYSYRVGGEGAW